jgi:hypothetical protein
MRPATIAPATDRGPGIPCIRFLSQKTNPQIRGSQRQKTQRRQQLRGGNRASARRIIPIGDPLKPQQNRQKFATPPFIDGKNSVSPAFPPESPSCRIHLLDDHRVG